VKAHRHLDINCDLGEGAGHDSEIMPLITSANIACGGHAGDADSMRSAVRLALRHGVSIGAHPGFPDPGSFGRVERQIEPRDAGPMVARQIRTLQKAAAADGGRVSHVKLHGALYNQASRDEALAASIASAVSAVNPGLVLFCPAGSRLLEAGRARGLRVAREVFADRTYGADGSLTPRTRRGALIADSAAAIAQVLGIAVEGRVRAADGTEFGIEADTVCLHGDGPNPVEFARSLRRALGEAGIEVRPFSC
jgi:UPF0271 protein